MIDYFSRCYRQWSVWQRRHRHCRIQTYPIFSVWFSVSLSLFRWLCYQRSHWAFKEVEDIISAFADPPSQFLEVILQVRQVHFQQLNKFVKPCLLVYSFAWSCVSFVYDLPQQVCNLLRPFLLLVQFCQVLSLKYNLPLVCNNSDPTMDGDLERMDCWIVTILIKKDKR